MNRIMYGVTAVILTITLSIGYLLFQSNVFSSVRAADVRKQSSEIPKAITNIEYHATNLFNKMKLEEAGLSYQVFQKALVGYYNLKQLNALSDKHILSIVDFDQLSTRKRFFIIDLKAEKLLLNTFVAHGENSGWDRAQSFSNTNDSFESSLGFYVTGEVYYGKHGKSLRLDGMDEGFNDQARSRAIVLHGADYVSERTIKQLGRLGRSQGCPAVPVEFTEQAIAAMQSKTVLFVHKSTPKYDSKFLNQDLAVDYLQSKIFEVG